MAVPSASGKPAGTVAAVRPPIRPSRTSSPTLPSGAPSGILSSAAVRLRDAPGGAMRVSRVSRAGVAATVVSQRRSATGARLAPAVPAVTTMGAWYRGRTASAPAVAPVRSTSRRRVPASPSVTDGAAEIRVTRS